MPLRSTRGNVPRYHKALVKPGCGKNKYETTRCSTPGTKCFLRMVCMVPETQTILALELLGLAGLALGSVTSWCQNWSSGVSAHFARAQRRRKKCHLFLVPARSAGEKNQKKGGRALMSGALFHFFDEKWKSGSGILTQMLTSKVPTT